MSARNCSVSVTVAVAVARTLAVCRVAISAWIISRNCSISVTVAVTGDLPVWKYASACCMISVGEQRLFAARSFNNDSSSAVNQRVQDFSPFWRFASRQAWTRADSLIGRASLWWVTAMGTVTRDDTPVWL